MPQPQFESYVTQILSKYQYAERARRDVLNAIKFYKNLSPKQEMFVFNDGTRKELGCLSGTIPVNYKGVTYNIPICIWLLDTHPYNSPMCFVKPTVDMEIKVSRHVDQSGRIYLPYLHEWNPSSSDLLGLIQVMVMVFGETPPVYSKPKNQQTNFSQSYFNATGYVPPTSTGISQPYPPYPSVTGPTSYRPTTNNFPNFPPYQPPPTSGYNPPPSGTPYPPYPSNNSMGTSNPPTTGSSYPPVAGSFPPYFPQPPTTATGGMATSANPSQQAGPNGAIQGCGGQASQIPNTGTISQEHIRASLLSAVEDKLKKRLKETVAQAQAEMEVLKKTHEDLNSGKSKLEEISSQIDREQTELESNIQVLRDKNEEMQEILSRLEGQESVDIDEVVVTTAPLYKQLLNAFAEESATEDAIYYLGEALRRGVIDLDVFLKNVRELSRKQFMLRALMQKCRQKAALPY